MRAEHLWFVILNRCRSNDVGEVFYDQQVLFKTMPKARYGIDKIHWLELEAWIDEIDQIMARMKKPPEDPDTLYTIFVKQAQLKTMKILELHIHEHEKIPVSERTWQDMKERIQKLCRERRLERNNAIRQAGKTVAMHARVPRAI